MCTEQLPPGGYPIAVKCIISYQITSTASVLWHTVFTLSSYAFHSNSLQAYLNTNTVSESKFPGVNKHITIQGHQQNAAETIWKLINVNRLDLTQDAGC
jgi:hypothetical protein